MSGTMTLHEQLQAIGETLAAELDSRYPGLSAEERGDLRLLPCALIGIADRVETIEQERNQLAALCLRMDAETKRSVRRGGRILIGILIVFAVLLWRAA